jgi:hypothetical protein
MNAAPTSTIIGKGEGKKSMLGVFQTSYQVCRRAPANVAGPRDEYRRPLEEALVVAADSRQLVAVITANVKLESGEEVEILQYRQIGRGIQDVFVAANFRKRR